MIPASDPRLVGISQLTGLTAADWADLQTFDDPADIAQLLKSYADAGATINRSTLEQVREYLSTISASDWVALLKLALPVLLPLL